MKTGLHIIIYSPYPSCAGGRENWLNQICKYYDRNKYDLNIYAFKSNSAKSIGSAQLHSVWIPQSIIQNKKTTHNIASRVTRKNLLSSTISYCYEFIIILSIFCFSLSTAAIIARNSKKYHKNIAIALGAYIEPKPVLYIKKLFRIKLITFVRGQLGGEIENAKMLKADTIIQAELYNMRKSDIVLCNGKDIKSVLTENNIESHFIHNAIDKKLFTNKGKVPTEFLKFEGKKIISVAALRDIKGIKELILAIPEIKKYYRHNFKVFFIGKGNSAKYKILAKQYKCDKYISFLGEKNNVNDYMKSADLMCCFSDGGGVPTVATEGKASKCLIIADDSIIYRQEIKNNTTGFLVDKDTPEIVGMKIAILLSSKNQKITQKAYKEAMALPNWDGYTKYLENKFLS